MLERRTHVRWTESSLNFFPVLLLRSSFMSSSTPSESAEDKDFNRFAGWQVISKWGEYWGGRGVDLYIGKNFVLLFDEIRIGGLSVFRQGSLLAKRSDKGRVKLGREARSFLSRSSSVNLFWRRCEVYTGLFYDPLKYLFLIFCWAMCKGRQPK